MNSLRVFISYCHEDGAKFAIQVYDYLTTIGLDTWMFRFSKTNGIPPWKEIANEIRDRDIAIVIITIGSHISIGQERECGIISHYNKSVYLLKASNAEILPELSYATWETFTNKNLQKLCEALPVKLYKTIRKKGIKTA